MSLQSCLKALQSGQDLSREDMTQAMRRIMEGEISDIEIAAFLFGLSVKGETTEEITGATQVLREKVLPVKAPEGAIDCCGTGGDASGTYNISTAVALVCAACGVPMAKHGNRSASSKSGAADVLEAMGVKLNVPKEKLEDALAENNFAFLMAPQHHSAMKHVVTVRKALGVRTLFNLLGPLANPAGTKRQLIGVFDPKWLRPMAETLRNLGSEKAWIVHGAFDEKGGLDEISTTGSTWMAVLENGEITDRTLQPEDFGLKAAQPQELKGGNAGENAQALEQLLSGAQSAYRDIVLANASAALNIAGKAADLQSGVAMAAEAIDSGKAAEILHKTIAFTQEHGNR